MGGALAAVVLFAITVALVPLTHTRPVGPDEQLGARVGLSVPSRVVITQTVPGAVVVQPRLVMPEVFTPSLIEPGGSFGADQRGLTSVSAGSVTLAGTFGDVNLAFAAVPEAAGVTVQRQSEGQTRTWQLTPDDLRRGSSLRVPSPFGQSSVSRAYLFSGDDVAAGGEITVGGDAIRTDGGQYTAAAAFPSVAGAALRGWGILAAGVLTVCLLWLLGRSLLRTGSAASRSVPTVAIGLGLGLALCVANALAYVVSARTAAYAVTALAVVALGLGHRRIRAGLRQDLTSMATRVVWVLPAAVLAFFPVFYWGLWYSGQYQTDLYEYATLSSIAKGSSLFDMRSLAEAQHSGTVTSGAGFVWRSIDSVSGGVVSALTNLSTVPALTFVGLVLFLVSGIAVMDLAAGHERVGSRRVGSRPGRLGLVIAAVALLNPLLTGLFVENYYSQFFFVALVPVLVVVLRVALTLAATSTSGGATWGVAALAGAMVAVYPYFFAVVALALAAATLSRSGTRRVTGRLLWSVAWRMAVLVNLAMLTVLHYGETKVYEASLDAIARTVLIPGWGRIELASMFGGFQSYQLRGVIPEAEVTGPLGIVVRVLDRASAPPVALLVLGLALLLVLLVSVDLRATLATFQARAIYAVALAWIVFCLYYGWAHRPYVMLKSGWVVAALLPCVVAVTRFHRVGRWTALVAVTTLGATAWVPTMLADRATWLVPLSGAFDRGSHVSVVPELASVLRAINPGDRVALVMGAQPLAGSDRDRVLLAQTGVLLRDTGAICVNCDGLNQPGHLDCLVARPDAVITIGVSGAVDPGCGLPKRAPGTLIDVYGG